MKTITNDKDLVSLLSAASKYCAERFDAAPDAGWINAQVWVDDALLYSRKAAKKSKGKAAAA